jgi:hypothetical protein
MVSLGFRVSIAAVRLFGVVAADDRDVAEVGGRGRSFLQDFQALE